MAASRIPAAIDAILSALRASADLADPVQVYDGPIITGDTPADAVYVGYDGNPDGDMVAVETTQRWDGIGAERKRESITVTCCAISWSGDTNVKAMRDATCALYSAAETALRADPSITLSPPTVAAVTEGQFFQEQGPRGLQTRLVFTISVSTRI